MRLFAATILLAVTTTLSTNAHSQNAERDGGVSVQLNAQGRGEELLESLYVPPIANAPFSLTLHTEWSRPLANGGTYTVVNDRPIKRDSAGRIYQERWLLAPKATHVHSRMSWIQIADPVAHTLTECSAVRHVCEVSAWNGRAITTYTPPAATLSGLLPDGTGFRAHEDLGVDDVLGVSVHAYRDTLTLNAGTMGNDRPMSIKREYRFSPELGFNLTSALENPRVGRQDFVVTEIMRSEPEARFFVPPAGWKILDYRDVVPAER